MKGSAVRVIMSVSALFLMVGCSSIYKKDTDCPGYLETGHCYDLREAYDAANKFDRAAYRAKLRGQADNGNGGLSDAETPIHRPPQPYMASDPQPRPILTQAVPVRVFIDPYEDQAGRLHTPGYIYVRVREPEWIFGHEQTQGSRVSTPLIRKSNSN